MKYGILIEHNIRNNFLEKSCGNKTKCGRETIPRPFSKNNKWISLDQYSKISYFVSIVCQAENYQKWLGLSCRPLAFTLYKAVSKNKEVWN